MTERDGDERDGDKNKEPPPEGKRGKRQLLGNNSRDKKHKQKWSEYHEWHNCVDRNVEDNVDAMAPEDGSRMVMIQEFVGYEHPVQGGEPLALVWERSCPDPEMCEHPNRFEPTVRELRVEHRHIA